MSDVTRRIERWHKKYSPEKAKATLEELHEGMSRRYEAATVALADLDLRVKNVLNMHGVHTTNYVPYLSYARQLWKLTQQQNIHGDSLALASDVLLQKWASRGQDPLVLDAIRFGVFGIVPPAP
jgi:hypothetical protein